jgi:effector-binding domain-containing protein
MDGTITTVTRQITIATKVRSAPADMPSRVSAAIARVRRGLKAGSIAAAGPAYARYLRHDETSGLFDLEVGVPVAAALQGYGDIYPAELPGRRVIVVWHEGPYTTLGDSFAKLEALLIEQDLLPDGPAWESYVVGPESEPDASRWRTAIHQPI